MKEGRTHVYRQAFFSGHVLNAHSYHSRFVERYRYDFKIKIVTFLDPVSLYGVRTGHIKGKPAEHRTVTRGIL